MCCARLLDLFGGFLQIVDPHSKMDKAKRSLAGRKPWHISFEFEQSDVDRPVGYIDADSRRTNPLHAKSFLEERGSFFDIGYRKRDVTQPGNHGQPLSWSRRVNAFRYLSVVGCTP